MDQITSNLYLSSIFQMKVGSKLKKNNIQHILSILSRNVDEPTSGVAGKYDLADTMANTNTNYARRTYDSEFKKSTQNTKILQHTSTNKSENNITYKAFTTIADNPTTAPILKQILPECLLFIHQARKNEENVLVHCVAGRSRSASVVIAYLMTVTGENFENIFEKVLAKREIGPNSGYLEMLKGLDCGEYRELLRIGESDYELF